MILRFVLASLALAALLPAQPQVINEAAQSISFGGKTIALGTSKSIVVGGRLPEKPIIQNRKISFPKHGVTVIVDTRNRVSFLQMAAPFKGRTKRGIMIGSTTAQLRTLYPAIGNVRPGWNSIPGLAFLVKGTGITRIQMATNNPLAKAKPKPPVRPKPTPVNPKPRPTNPRPNRPGQKPPLTGRPPILPTPRPTRPATPANPGVVGPNLASTTVIWDHTWQARPGKQWVPAPAAAWPTNRGRLLVRVATSPGVVAVDEKIAGVLLANIPSKDLVTPPDFIEDYIRKRGGRTRTWLWSATGRGKIHVQVIWFPTEKQTARYMRQNPYHDFARSVLPVVVAPPVHVPQPVHTYEELVPRMKLIWEHDWPVDPRSTTWVEGPDRQWARDGVLVLRAWGSRHVKSVHWRAGKQGGGTRLTPGDHLLETRILDGQKPDPLSAIFGGRPQNHHLWIGATGRGRVNVQLWWAPHRSIVKRWCNEHPFAPVFEVPVVVDPRTAPGHVTVTFTGSLVNAQSGLPVADTDVIVQMRALPRTVYGGLRTDAQGRFAFDVAVPIGTEVVIRVPGYRIESRGRTFTQPREQMVWDVRVP